mmetsp:Transcript_7730/g.9217  ORF Transcript_7730/g.9217 Transcript_7730/m.9217 type:complete len:208 (-) Transcript_7730:65-688(-)
MLFFLLANIIYANVFTCSSTQTFDSGGRQWEGMYWCIVSGLITSQLTLTGVLLIKGGLEQAVLMQLLVAGTSFSAYSIDATYRRLVKHIPVFTANEIDNLVSVHAVNENGIKDVNRETDVPRIVELEPSIWQYDTITPGHDDNAHRRAPAPKHIINVYTYKHPVLSEPLSVRPHVKSTSSNKIDNIQALGTFNGNVNESSAFSNISI